MTSFRYTRTMVDGLRNSTLFQKDDSLDPYWEKVDIPSSPEMTIRAPGNAQLPSMPLGMRHRYQEHILIRVPNVHFSILAPFLEDMMVKSDELMRFKWNSKECSWHVEYGTAPREVGVPLNEYVQIRRMQNIAHQVADIAHERYHIDDGPRRPPESRLLWCQVMVHVLKDHENNAIYLRMRRHSSMGFSAQKRVYELLASYVTNNSLLLARYAYLQLLEGCSAYNCREPILLYLFDDFVSRELCTYIQNDGVYVDTDGDDSDGDDFDY